MPLLIVQVVFWVVAGLILGAALLVVSSKDVIHAALWLISAFFGVGALYLLLEAEFLAIVQVLVYVGAISVLVLFAIMLLRHLGVAGERRFTRHWWLGAVLSVGLFGGVLLPTLVGYDWGEHGGRVPVAELSQMGEDGMMGDDSAGEGALPTETGETGEHGDTDAAELAGVEAIGTAFMREYLLPFEIASIVLLVALIGAIVIAFEERATRRPVLTLAEEVTLRKQLRGREGDHAAARVEPAPIAGQGGADTGEGERTV
jgi:NADH-quinone oxidoreductase subunit J